MDRGTSRIFGVSAFLALAVLSYWIGSNVYEAWAVYPSRQEGSAVPATHAISAILSVDGDSSLILSANSRVFGLFGYRPEELIGKDATVLVPPELLDDYGEQRTSPTRRTELLTSHWNWNGHLLQKDGKRVFIIASLSGQRQGSRYVFTAEIHRPMGTGE